jgi:hypothetical protein
MVPSAISGTVVAFLSEELASIFVAFAPLRLSASGDSSTGVDALASSFEAAETAGDLSLGCTGRADSMSTKHASSFSNCDQRLKANPMTSKYTNVPCICTMLPTFSVLLVGGASNMRLMVSLRVLLGRRSSANMLVAPQTHIDLLIM